ARGRAGKGVVRRYAVGGEVSYPNHFLPRTGPMLRRKYIFPNVIELNYQAGRRLGVNVYLIDGNTGDYALIDIGFEDTVNDIVDLIGQMDFSLSKCKAIVAPHADADQIQGPKKPKERLKTRVLPPPLSSPPIERGDAIETYASITA